MLSIVRRGLPLASALKVTLAMPVFCFLDRNAIGNARLYGLTEDIGASDLECKGSPLEV